MLKLLRANTACNGQIRTIFSTSPLLEDLPADMSQEERRAKQIEQRVAQTRSLTKNDLMWREEVKERYELTALRMFYDEKSKAEELKNATNLGKYEMSVQAIKNWYNRKQIQYGVYNQKYLAERVRVLGNELAAAHFIVYRGGAVKFHDEDYWVKSTDYNNYKLPTTYLSDKVLQAIDCSTMVLHYEGLATLKGLQNLEWLCLMGSYYMDDWCLDKISNIFSHSLLYLDLRDCPNITLVGFGSLQKFMKLKVVLVNTFLDTQEFELIRLMLEEINPKLDIRFE